uniref:Uncharacterized protein n=1 Tax=Sphingobacterium sp. (strain 21) TaxID=743722 RepID=F4C454_SPHS2
MSFVIGEEIKKIAKLRKFKNAEFADAMNMEERNLYHFFKKSDLTLDQLVDASKVLEYDFISLYLKHKKGIQSIANLIAQGSNDIVEEKAESYQRTEKRLVEPKNQISFTVKIFGDYSKIREEIPSLLDIIKEQAELRGLHMG